MAVEPNTDAAPLTANPQSTSEPTRSVPFGKGIPMKKPSGSNSTMVTNMRPEIGNRTSFSVRNPNSKTSRIIQAMMPKKGVVELKREEKKLPIPEAQ